MLAPFYTWEALLLLFDVSASRPVAAVRPTWTTSTGPAPGWWSSGGQVELAECA